MGFRQMQEQLVAGGAADQVDQDKAAARGLSGDGLDLRAEDVGVISVFDK